MRKTGIILNRPFVAIITGDEGKDEHLMTLLRTVGLEKQILHESMTEEVINRPIDYAAVNEKIDRMKASSVEYIMNAIS
ncbi:MAG: hypothetical protein IJS59_01050 [Bacteroidaceae bacterium]|nr:hypothetical protein [Bacteroidaceae bacterium]